MHEDEGKHLPSLPPSLPPLASSSPYLSIIPQSNGLDVGLCGLHHKEDKLGLSFLLQGLLATSAVPLSSDPSCLLECARLQVGDVKGDLSLRDSTHSVPSRQLAFLKKADSRSQRLWFLWPQGSDQTLQECGCCGGCLFLGDYIRRPEGAGSPGGPLEVSEEGGKTYNPTSLHTLKKVLTLYAITDRECLAQLHQGLLKYVGVSEPETNTAGEPHSSRKGEGPLSTEAKFYSAPSGRTSPSDSLSSYVSANSTFSLAEEGNSGEGCEPTSSRKSWRQSRHMGGRLGVADEHTLLYKDFSPTHTCHLTVLYVPMKQLSAVEDSTPASQYESPQLNVRTLGKAPPPPPATIREGLHHTPKMMVMKLPLLEHPTPGLLPVVTERAKRQKERGRRTVDSNTSSLGGEGSLAMASLCLNVCDRTQVVVSPLLLPVVER